MASPNPYADYRGIVWHRPARNGAGEDGDRTHEAARARRAERPESREAVTKGLEPTARQSRGSPIVAPEGGILSELRARNAEMNRELPEPSIAGDDEREVAQSPGAMGPSPTSPHSHYRWPAMEGRVGQGAPPGSEEGGPQAQGTEPRIWREPSMESGDGAQATQASEVGLAKVINKEIISELKMRIAVRKGELLEPSVMKDQPVEVPVSRGPGPTGDSAPEKWWPYVVGLIAFVGMVISAVVYFSVKFTRKPN